MNYFLQSIGLPLVLCLFFSACSNTAIENKDDSVVKVRLPAEPDRINPLLSVSGYAAQIEDHIFMPLLQFNSKRLELEPALAASMPDKEVDENTGEIKYSFVIKPEAKWSDGRPVTAKDYEFTLKVIMNPKVNAGPFRAYFGFIKNFNLDPDNPLKFSVLTKYPYVLAETALGNISVYPVHLFDPNGLMEAFSVEQLSEIKGDDHGLMSNAQLIEFGENFNKRNEPFNGTWPGGCGPYFLLSWQAGQQLELQRKQNFWGKKYEKESDVFKAYPEKIIYQFVPDINAAVSLLKNGETDAIGSVDQRVFADWLEDEALKNDYNLYTPSRLMYYYIGLNRQNPRLSSVKLRQAFAHLFDMEQIKTSVYYDMVERTVGPFHPDKSYYNKNLPLINYNLEKSKALFEQEGWKDSNGNGILDKEINNEFVEMNLTLDVSSSVEAGKQLGLILKSSAKKVGVNIDIEAKEFRKLSADYRARDYDLVYSAWSAFPGPDDPRQIWHTESATPDGANRVGFGNAESDALIDGIQIAGEEAQREKLYLKLQKMIYEDQPYIFLFVPQERIVIHKRFNTTVSSRRPGFFENTFQIKQNK